MAADLILVELKNILRAHGAVTTGNKAELIAGMKQSDPEGTWLAEFRKNQERNDSAGGLPGGSTAVTQTTGNESADIKQLLATMQAQILALSMQLQQKESVSTSSCQPRISRDKVSNLSKTSASSSVTSAPPPTTSAQVGGITSQVSTDSTIRVETPRVLTQIQDHRTTPSMIHQQVSFPGVEVSLRVSINVLSELLGSSEGNSQNSES